MKIYKHRETPFHVRLLLIMSSCSITLENIVMSNVSYDYWSAKRAGRLKIRPLRVVAPGGEISCLPSAEGAGCFNGNLYTVLYFLTLMSTGSGRWHWYFAGWILLFGVTFC